MNKWNERTSLLLGNTNVEQLSLCNVLVAGLGGVGAMAAEQLARAGIGQMTLVDSDVVEASNINRQIPALQTTIGHKKVNIMANRLMDINPKIQINVLDEYLRDQRMVEVLETSYDYVVDAIDTLAPKVYLIYHTLQKGYPLVSAMGSGGKTNPAKIKVADISKTNYCQLARMVRKRLHKLDIHKGFNAVYSTEKVSKNAIIEETGTNKVSNVGTISYMPAIFGCYCAAEVLTHLVQPSG